MVSQRTRSYVTAAETKHDASYSVQHRSSTSNAMYHRRPGRAEVYLCRVSLTCTYSNTIARILVISNGPPISRDTQPLLTCTLSSKWQPLTMCCSCYMATHADDILRCAGTLTVLQFSLMRGRIMLFEDHATPLLTQIQANNIRTEAPSCSMNGRQHSHTFKAPQHLATSTGDLQETFTILLHTTSP